MSPIISEINEEEVNKLEEIHKLIQGVFDVYIGPDYSEEGQRTFNEFILPENIKTRLEARTSSVYVAYDKTLDEILGVMEKRGETHISLFFVKPEYHRKGIGKLLIEKGFSGYTGSITVNASPYAMIIYEKLGFEKISGEIIKNGITYIPMIKEKN